MRPTAFSTFVSLSLCLLAPACGDDGGGDGLAGSSSGSATDAASTTTDTPVETDDTTGADPTTTSEDTTGPEPTGSDDTTTGEPVEVHYGALVLGTLYTDDLAMAQGTHDAVAMGGQRAAMAAGDYGHDALLGTTLLGTTENQFLGIDQWDNLEGALAVYGDPDFAAAFGMLFAAPPSLELFERREDWHGWGSLEAGDAGAAHWYVVVRGRLVDADIDAMQVMHDAVAMGGEADATALGDVAHVVWVGTPKDPQQFFAVDVWTDNAAIEAFYGNPEFQAAFGALFEAPPTVGVYGSTDWHQW